MIQQLQESPNNSSGPEYMGAKVSPGTPEFAEAEQLVAGFREQGMGNREVVIALQRMGGWTLNEAMELVRQIDHILHGQLPMQLHYGLYDEMIPPFGFRFAADLPTQALKNVQTVLERPDIAPNYDLCEKIRLLYSYMVDREDREMGVSMIANKRVFDWLVKLIKTQELHLSIYDRGMEAWGLQQLWRELKWARQHNKPAPDIFQNDLSTLFAWAAHAQGERTQAELKSRIKQNTVMTFPDNWYVYKLQPEDCELEGDLMHNCVRGYETDVGDEGESNIYSIREPAENQYGYKPHVDIEIDGADQVVQVYGPFDKPPEDEFLPYIKAFFDKEHITQWSLESPQVGERQLTSPEQLKEYWKHIEEGGTNSDFQSDTEVDRYGLKPPDTGANDPWSIGIYQTLNELAPQFYNGTIAPGDLDTYKKAINHVYVTHPGIRHALFNYGPLAAQDLDDYDIDMESHADDFGFNINPEGQDHVYDWAKNNLLPFNMEQDVRLPALAEIGHDYNGNVLPNPVQASVYDDSNLRTAKTFKDMQQFWQEWGWSFRLTSKLLEKMSRQGSRQIDQMNLTPEQRERLDWVVSNLPPESQLGGFWLWLARRAKKDPAFMGAPRETILYIAQYIAEALRELRQNNRPRPDLDRFNLANGAPDGRPGLMEEMQQMMTDMKGRDIIGNMQYRDVVTPLQDNWTAEMIHPEDAATDATLMKNCLATKGPSIAAGNTMIYSLRDPQGMPHAAVLENPRQPNRPEPQYHPQSGSYVDSLGRANTRIDPGNPYRPYVDEFIQKLQSGQLTHDRSRVLRDNPQQYTPEQRIASAERHLRRWNEFVGSLNNDWHEAEVTQ